MENFIVRTFKNNFVQISIPVLGLAITLVNIFIASRLSPLVEDINAVAVRVGAVEKFQDENAPLVERFIIVEQKVSTISDDVTEVKSAQLRMEGKIDNLLLR